jgi:hypothetical protein
MAIVRKEPPQTGRPVEGEMNQLAELEHFTPLYWNARQALEKAESFDEVLEIRNQADAHRAYAAMAKDDELLRLAGELKLRAQRRAGEMLEAGPLRSATCGIEKGPWRRAVPPVAAIHQCCPEGPHPQGGRHHER